ncbi:MAG: hypothetical protein WA364_18835, partial [Candidatus Nitrosopolaris sp.]
DDTPLVLHLQHMFKLKGRQKYYINKENHTITVSPESAAPIILKLSDTRDKVTMMSTVDGQYKSLEYDVHKEDSEMMVSRRIPSKETAIGIINHAQKKIEQLIYGFLCELASSEPEESKKFSYYYEILSRDDKFMKVVEEIYQNRDKAFERSYKRLTNNS